MFDWQTHPEGVAHLFYQDWVETVGGGALDGHILSYGCRCHPTVDNGVVDHQDLLEETDS